MDVGELSNIIIYLYFTLSPVVTVWALWYISKQLEKERKKARETKTKMMTIELNKMVTLTVGDQVWIGQVVEIREEVALVRLAGNMHYHANLSELTLFTQKTPEVQK